MSISTLQPQVSVRKLETGGFEAEAFIAIRGCGTACDEAGAKRMALMGLENALLGDAWRLLKDVEYTLRKADFADSRFRLYLKAVENLKEAQRLLTVQGLEADWTKP